MLPGIHRQGSSTFALAFYRSYVSGRYLNNCVILAFNLYKPNVWLAAAKSSSRTLANATCDLRRSTSMGDEQPRRLGAIRIFFNYNRSFVSHRMYHVLITS